MSLEENLASSIICFSLVSFPVGIYAIPYLAQFYQGMKEKIVKRAEEEKLSRCSRE